MEGLWWCKDQHGGWHRWEDLAFQLAGSGEMACIVELHRPGEDAASRRGLSLLGFILAWPTQRLQYP